MKLNKATISTLLEQLDEAAQQQPIQDADLIMIGSAALILQGMEDRVTIDIDFWQTSKEAKIRMGVLSRKVGIDFDPNDYSNREDPYIQWITPGFVHMPIDETWKNHTSIAWLGKNIVINMPPIGVILGSKLAAGREQDMDDIRYIVGRFPDWQENLDRWIPHFSKSDQQDIQDNLIFAQIFVTPGAPGSSRNRPKMKPNHPKHKEESAWLDGLHPKLGDAFRRLCEEHQLLVLNAPPKLRRRALRTLDYKRRGINGRNKWVNGLENLGGLLNTHTYFLMLMLNGKTSDVESVIDIIIDFNTGEHESTRQTDPVIYDLISQANNKYRQHGYDKLDVMEISRYFKKHPEYRPLKGRYPDEQQIAQRRALKIGAQSKLLRRTAGMTQEEMAGAINTCTKTIKNLEAGRAVSSHTMLMAQNVLARIDNEKSSGLRAPKRA
jgi:DNA-binding XRE family transcriptional regulator